MAIFPFQLSPQQIAVVWTTVVVTVPTVISAWSAYWSMRAAKESELARKFDFIPILAISFFHSPNPKRIVCRLKNVGRDLARHIIVYLPNTEPRPLDQNLSKDQESGEETIPVENVSILSIPADKRRIVVEYKDLFDRKISTYAYLLSESDNPIKDRYQHLTIDTWQIELPK